MNNKLSKIFNKNNIKIIIPIIVLIVLLIIVFIYLKEYKSNQYRNKQDNSFYQYFAGAKVEYDATISFNKDNEIKAFVPKEYEINYDSIPIYYQEEEKVIFPSEMNIIFPLKNTQHKTKEFSYIEKVNNINYLTFEDYRNNVDHYILFDGNNLYFFSDSVNLTINNEEITLSPMSYIIVKSNQLSYYNYETDEYKIIDTTEQIIVTNEYLNLNASNDYLADGDSNLLLFNDLSFLDYLTNEE